MLGLDNPIHILFILVVVLLVFGAKRLPEMGKSLGEGLRGFKDSVTGDHSPAHMLDHPPAAPHDATTITDHPATADDTSPREPADERVPATPAA